MTKILIKSLTQLRKAVQAGKKLDMQIADEYLFLVVTELVEQLEIQNILPELKEE